MIVGSLIKNPGGGLAPIGGYICGTKACVERCAYRLSAPGLGQEVGANLGLMPSLYQGFFLAPTVVAGALKGAIFAANVYEKLGFRVVPNSHGDRATTSFRRSSWARAEAHDRLLRGHSGRRAGGQLCPPRSRATMPGYDSEVIMAAGALCRVLPSNFPPTVRSARRMPSISRAA